MTQRSPHDSILGRIWQWVLHWDGRKQESVEGLPPIERYMNVIFQTLALFRFFSFAMGAGLLFSLNTPSEPSLAGTVVAMVAGGYTAIRVLWRFNPVALSTLTATSILAGDLILSISLVTLTGGPFEGAYHAQLQANTGEMTQSIDLSGQTNVRWKFWAKADSFESGETATCSVSDDGVGFTVVRIWVDGEDDNVYRFEDIDLSSFAPYSSNFRFRCNANMSGGGDLFWVDDMDIVSQDYGQIIAESSDTKGPGGIFIDGSLIAGGAYTVEFFNNSLVDFVSDGFSTDGNSGDTWIYVQAYKDYIVIASAESSTIATLIRQIPGPTSPITAQKIYIQSWREP